METKTDYVVEPLSADHKYLHFMSYRDVICDSELQIYDEAGTLFFQRKFTNTAINTWEEIVLDLTDPETELPGIEGKKIGKIWIMVNVGGGVNFNCYFDEFVLNDDDGSVIDIINWDSETLVTFEPETESPFEYAIEGGTLDAAKANPDMTGENTTATCLWGDYSAGTDWWYKIKMETKTDYVVEPLSADHKYLHFMSYRDVICDSELQIYDEAGTLFFQRKFTNTAINTWEEIVLDLTDPETELPGIEGKKIGKIWIMVNVGSGVNFNCYFDEFILNDDDGGGPNNVANTNEENVKIQVVDGFAAVYAQGDLAVDLISLNGAVLKSATGTDSVTLPLVKGVNILKVTQSNGTVDVRKVVY